MLVSLLCGAAILQTGPASVARPSEPGEVHLTNIRQLTFGGQNAEAYWSVDGKYLVYQTAQPQYPDEQIYLMKADGSGKVLVSTGKGRCTCSYFSPDMKWIYFSSTHERNEGPQKAIDFSKGYVWMINPDYSLYRIKAAPFLKGQRPEHPVYEKVIDWGSYVAETTIAPNGKYMTWTADKDGDLNIYRSDLNGKNVKQLTDKVGYDGGPFVSWDSKKIAYRRDAFENDAQVQTFKDLLAEHLIRPSKLEIWVMDADGSNKVQVTNLKCASFAPFVQPGADKIVFSSNHGDPKGREFDIFRINTNGRYLERITRAAEFDGFPMFSRDGKKFVFCSNRFGSVRGETNVFVADWKE